MIGLSHRLTRTSKFPKNHSKLFYKTENYENQFTILGGKLLSSIIICSYLEITLLLKNWDESGSMDQLLPLILIFLVC